MHDLDIGGVQRLYLDVLSAACAQGRNCRVIASDGALAAETQRRGIIWEPLAVSAAAEQSFAELHRLTATDQRTVFVADPRMAHLLSAVTSLGPTVLALHSSAPRLADWFRAPAFDQLSRTAKRLCEAGDLLPMVISDRGASQYSQAFGIPRERIVVLPPLLDPTRLKIGARGQSFDTSCVLCPCRLSPEKRSHIVGGIELVRSRIAAGQRGRLEVVGDGPWMADAEALCRARLPAGTWRFHGMSEQPFEVVPEAGVVIATGIAALEAAWARIPVVLVRTVDDDSGSLGPVLSPARFHELARNSFVSARELPPHDVELTWRDLDALDRQALSQIHQMVVCEHSPDAGVAILHEAFERLQADDPPN